MKYCVENEIFGHLESIIVMKKFILNTAPILYFIVSFAVMGFIAFGLQMILGIQVMKSAINVLLVFGFLICVGGMIVVDVWRENKIEKNK